MLEEGKHGERLIMPKRDTTEEPTADAEGSPAIVGTGDVPSNHGGAQTIAVPEHKIARHPDYRHVTRPPEEP